MLHSRPCLARPLLTPLAAALAAALAAPVCAQDRGPDEPIELRASPALQPPVRGEAANRLPIILNAQSVSGSPDLDAVAEGNVEFRRSGTVIRADKLRYEQVDDLATALGHVRISRDGNVYSGPELQLKVQRFEGFFRNPTYYFARTGAGGTAQRIDFLDEQRATATAATYTSCPADDTGSGNGPAWLLTTDKVHLDFATNEGIAEGGVLRFYGVPILAAPRLSFPLTDDRKSGWLPPSMGLDSKSGFQFSMPYYWNIAPNRDATITPAISTRRGPSVETEFRYLEPNYAGEVKLNLMPNDRVNGKERYALAAAHDSDFGNGLRLQMRALRVSDDDYWKDFPRDVSSSLTPRLLPSDFQVSRPFGDWTTYARVQKWQVLQTVDPTTRIEAPYERAPQLGARYGGRFGPGFQVGFETEFNRFTDPTNASLVPRPTGNRVHALGSVAWPYVTPGWTLTPKIAFNAASYAVDQPPGASTGAANGSRVIPTVSLDSAWVFERDTRFFGKAMRQTLEPRLLYVNTPYRDQSGLPNFDAYAKDFNFDSIFTESAFSGVDRVSDAHQVTAGVTTRFIDPDTGAERLRLGLAQRYLLRDQFVTPDGKPLTQRFSDLLLLGSTTVIPSWSLDASVQYSPDSNRVSRSVVGARYSPGPYRTISATYRLTRGLSEQVELGWQWPLYGPTPDASRPRSTDGSGCQGSWYGVGRVNYSTLERRLVDAVVGVEYDAGCWIGRVVATRQSTGLSEATTRLLFQLELVGLSRLGSNPLQVLKDNIPGYKLLREGRAVAPASSAYD
ncbi:LPS-assembly protein LptD [Rhizobacter sp. Root404]|uniref:LPS-assembly protein LptD n=1 Tax=Rhizobacter sp. Root404 TaxID=1736528 RepID=UPI000A57465E|nr:LPS assembly protein LptD [Rhizobacter sp. Root404]